MKQFDFLYTKVLVLILMLIALNPGTAHAGGTLGDMFDRIRENSSSLPDVVSFVCYMTGFLFAGLGIYKLKNHVEHGPQSVPLADPLKILLTGSIMLALPSIGVAMQETFGDEGDAQEIGWTPDTGAVSGGTLDGMMMKVMENAYVPFVSLLTFFCFTAGAILLAVAVHRFTKTAQEGARGPTGLGTMATFMLAGVLFSIAPSVGTFTETIFGGRESMTTVDFLALSGGDADAKRHAENVVVSILAFMIIVGLISIVRGFFILRGVAEGTQQMTMMSGLSHIIAGALLVNFGQFANIIQETLGLTGTGLNFS
ncbi:MAG: hypothetical protein COB76_02285 [Alphaproteobacteria bacterium]|nr:MAG: hypothetical protein COB76_02285 [Alphaproteobacteria bacterium]